MGDVQLHPGRASGQRGHGGRRGGMVVADFDRGIQSGVRGVKGNPVATLGDELVAHQRRIVTHHDPVVGGVQLDDAERLR